MGQGIETPATPTVEVYSSAAKVAALLQVPAFTDAPATTPTLTQVNEMVLRAQDEIDRRTGHAWRTINVVNEYHDMYPAEYRFYWSVPRIRLNHRDVKALASVSGDKLEIFDATGGATGYTDWVVSKVENRKTGDFWADYENGYVYFIRSFPIWRYAKGVRVTYRFGSTYLPKWVEDIATKMAALDVLEGFKQYMYTQEDLARIPPGETARRWAEEIAAKLDEQAWVLRPKRARLI